MGFSLSGAVKSLGNAVSPTSGWANPMSYGIQGANMLTGGGVTGDGGSAMDLIPGIGDARAQDEANRINIQQADINRKFQERMSNTAYQRAMADMKSAGLNPTLAYMQGGASQPSGSQATVQAASKTGLAHFAMKAAMNINSAQQESKRIEQQSQLNDSNIKLNAATAVEKAANAQKIQQETKGLGRKASEGALWDKFYKGVNNVLDNSSKDVEKRGLMRFLQGPEKKPNIKVLGPGPEAPLIRKP
ncbi:minor capsid protein [Microviridae sp.]|nr:minor capsid protein [Microviridae sp.]